MTGPHFDAEDAADAANAATRPISVAELLARNGNIGSPPVTGRRRRRRGNSDAVTVAELTGEIPVIDADADEPPPDPDEHGTDSHAHQPNGSARTTEAADDQAAEDDRIETVNWSEPGPRWPESPPQGALRSGPQRSPYPLPQRKADRSGAEQMSPDPAEDYADIEVDVMDTDVRDAELPAEDSAYVRSYLRGPRALFGKRRNADAPPDLDEGLEAEADEDLDADPADEVGDPHRESIGVALLRVGAVVVQSMVAVAFGAGLFIGFDQLWKWNSIVALVLAVLVILGLVTAVQVVRKTVDTASTLFAVAVGALIAFGPLALLQSG